MNNKQREIKLTTLQINLKNFKEQCEDDFRRIIASFLKALKNPQSGGVILKFNFLNSFDNKNNQSQKSTKNYSERKISSPLTLPNVNQSLLQNVKEIPKKPINRNRILHECQVYEYLKKKSEYFIDTSTCFVRCSDDSFFLRNCGITFEELIKENLNNTSLFQYILEKLFEKIHFLHLLGVAHNNLDCSHVLVGKRENINWTRMRDNKLKNLPANSYINMPFLRKNIDIRLINFSKATILQPGLEIDVDYLKGIFEHYTKSLQTFVR